tara:strand:- start:562 stop:933 length:372 start_codon:yes stop_codon:yes gene_type:complete
MKYYGPLYKKEKNNFFRKVDFFIFLSEYVNESEPLALLEALSYGCIPIVFNIGSIKDLVCNEKLIVENSESTCHQIDNLISSISRKNEIATFSVESYNHFLNLRKKYQSNLKLFIDQVKEKSI